MNLYFRMIWLFFSVRFKRPISIFSPLTTRHRVWANDIDLLGHMNNGRYFTVTDLVRTQILMRCGIWSEMKKKKAMPLMAGETVQFRKPLMPFQRYGIHTRLLGWDSVFFYVEHRFESRKGTHALMLVRGRVVGRGSRRYSPREFFQFVHREPLPETRMDRVLSTWSKSAVLHWDIRHARATAPAESPGDRSEACKVQG